LCGGIFQSVFLLRRHRKTHRVDAGNFVIKEKAFRKQCVIYQKTYSEKMITLDAAFEADKIEMKNILEYELEMKSNLKASIIFHAEFVKPVSDGSEELLIYVLYLRTTTFHLCNQNEIPLFMQQAREGAEIRIDDFVSRGSGWILDEILATDIEIGACGSLNGSCSFLSVNSIKCLKSVPVVSSLHSDEQKCFFEAIAYHYTKCRNKKRLIKFIDKYINLSVKTPVKLNDIEKFERDNPQLDCKVNVLFNEDEVIFPIHVSKNPSAKNIINLLLYKTKVGSKIVSHYAYIDDLNKLLRKTYRGETTGKKQYATKAFHCPNCLQSIGSELSVANHVAACMENKPQKIILPEEGEKVKFKNFKNKFPVHYVGFVDFEAVQSTPTDKCETCARKSSKICNHKTTIKSIQNPTTYSMLILNENDKIVCKETYSGEDCVEHLMDKLLSVEEELQNNLTTIREMETLTKEQEKEIEAAKKCHICEEDLLDDRVIDHDHVTSKYLGKFIIAFSKLQLLIKL